MVLTVIVVGAYVLFHRPMYVLTFSPATARAEGLPVQCHVAGFQRVNGGDDCGHHADRGGVIGLSGDDSASGDCDARCQAV